MAPRTIEEQTKMIINYLFEEAHVAQCKMSFTETDGVLGVKSPEDSFDPKLIADKLRKLGDDYDETVIQPLMTELQKAAADKVQAAFKSSVECLCESWLAQNAGVTPEPQLLKAAVMLGLYAKRNCPDLSTVVQGAMGAFINAHLAPWVLRQGGWEQVTLE